MLGNRIIIKRGGKDEAEKPFWISFADLMTALMVLFLVVMAVALLAVTKTVSEREKKEEHNREIELILERFTEAAAGFEGIKIDKERRVIDFGDRARFELNSHKLNPAQQSTLRKFVPEILTLAHSDLGKRVLKRIAVEGYTDPTGSYLKNLNLSLQRSQSVLCAMFATSGDNLLDVEQKKVVRSLFFVGGYSFNAARDSNEESRRVEMRLEFLGIGESRETAPEASDNFGECALK